MRSERKYRLRGLLKGVVAASALFITNLASGQAAPDDDVEINVGPAPQAAPAGGAPAPVPASAAPAPTNAEIEALKAQLRAVEERLAAAEARADDQEAAQHENEKRTAEREAAQAEQTSLLGRLAKLGVSISGYVQVQYGQNQLSEDQLQQGGTPYNQDRFAVRRGRLRIKGRWKYVRTDFEVDASTTRGPSASVRRASVSGVLPSKVDGELPYVLLTAGLTEIPLGLELQQGQDEILFLERTTGSLAFFSGPVDTGLKLELAYGALRAQVAVMNGAPLDDRAGGPSAVDPTRAPDYIARLGADVRPHPIFRVSGGVSFLAGTGFSPGSDATKPQLQWNDLDSDGSIGAGELVSVAGRGAIPSQTFKHWAVGADLSFELKTKIGLSRLYGEVYVAENLDRALYVADPAENGIDSRELSWYAAFIQDVTDWGFVGVRYDVYDPNSDLFDARRGRAVPKDASIKTISPVIGARWPKVGRFTFEYDLVGDKLARDHRGVPTDVANNQWTLRLQGSSDAQPILALLLATASLLAAACDSEPRLLGLDEPIVASNAELKHGDLPGDDVEDGARVTSLQLNFGVMTPGAPHLSVSGRTSDDAYAVAIRILELGTGYWLKPVGAPDPSLLDELTFEFVFQAAAELPPGQHTFAAVAFDEHGKAGPQYTIPVCIESDLPDNGNACDPEAEPPPAIVSLTWNADSDLDLTVQAPDGTRYDRSNRFLLEDGKEVFGLEYDGSTACLQDGRRRENFIWYEKPEHGSTWLIYANMFDACGRPAAPFELTVYRSKKNADGTYKLVADEPLRGEFLRAQQNGGVGTPLYLTAVQL